MNKKGFTMVELLAVIAVLGSLIVISSATIYSVTNRAKNRLYKQEEKNIEEAARMVAIDLDDYSSEIYNCDKEIVGSNMECDFTGDKWNESRFSLEYLKQNGYLTDKENRCTTGEIKITRTDTDYHVEITNLECDRK